MVAGGAGKTYWKTVTRRGDETRAELLHWAIESSRTTGAKMAKNQNTVEKRRREIEKKFKAEEKRKERMKKKSLGPAPLGDDQRDQRRDDPE